MLPKQRFWKDEQKMTSGVSIDFSMVRSPNWVRTPLEKCFETPDFIFCSSFQNLRGYNCAISHPRLYERTSYESNQQSGHIDTFLFNHFSFYCSLARLPSTHVCKFFRKVVGAKSRSFCSPYHTAHVGNSICETYPRMIAQGLNEAACMHTRQYVIFVNGLAQSGVGKSRKCCSHMACRQCDIPLRECSFYILKADWYSHCYLLQSCTVRSCMYPCMPHTSNKMMMIACRTHDDAARTCDP